MSTREKAAHGLFCHPNKKYNFVERGIVERLEDAKEESPVKDYYEFLFHKDALQSRGH